MHCDPNVLTAIAMGETDVSTDDIVHIASCSACSREISSIRRITELARSGPAEKHLLRPDDAVWRRISSTLALSDGVTPMSLRAEAPPGAAPAVDIRRDRLRRSRRWWVLPAAAAVVLLAGAAGAIIFAQRPTTVVLAGVTLEPLPEWVGSSGDARIERAADGQRDVIVTLQASEPTSDDRYREVWLLSADLSKLVSIGVLSGGSGSFVIPDGLDLRDYSIVDVSEEKLDGDPAHSGDSIVRGEIVS